VSFVQRIKPGDVIRYTLLPGVVPRLKDFARNGFGWLALLMAYIYACVKLLPANHPYLQPDNFGRYGVRHVIVEAANRLKMRRENIDQIVIFFVLLAGFVLLVMQFIVLGLSFVIHPALAGPVAPNGFAGFFTTPNPTTDIAYELLDKVFAVPNLYGSQYDPATAGMTPFSTGLHDLIRFYNIAILLVGVAIFLYYLVLVVAETANTGTPFGQRFSSIYAPLRLVIAVGLLIPLNYGYNSSQYIALFAAKYGSSLATNAWLLFNQTLTQEGGTNPLGGPNETMVARPQYPDFGEVVQFMALVRACVSGYYDIYTQAPYSTVLANEPLNIQPYLVWSATGSGLMSGSSYATAIGATEFNNRDIVIRFGDYSPNLYSSEEGNVYPLCGEMTVHIGDVSVTGATAVQTAYYNEIMTLWNDPGLNAFGDRAAAIYMHGDIFTQNPGEVSVGGGPGVPADTSNNLPGANWQRAEVDGVNQAMTTAINAARDAMVAKPSATGDASTFGISADLENRGWGGAAIWYNRIAMWNGALFGAVFNIPTASHVPSAMEKVEHENRIHNENVGADLRYEPYMQEGRPVGVVPGEQDLVRMLNAVYQYWRLDNSTSSNNQHRSGNFLMDIVNEVFPLDALMQIRYNIDVYPLAQLVGLGKGIIDSSVRNLAGGLTFAAGGGLLSALQSGMGPVLNYASSIMMTLSTLGLTMGFVLYYILPFLPFMYFFFAVGSWVKSIFEAMVGAPLWALAHLRVDGNGLPGDMAIQGYFLMFEIFVRPILILFGLLGGLIIFSAMARTLHDVFPLLVVNVSGYDVTALANPAAADPDAAYQGSPLDAFFYSVIYTILIYSMALSSFKMIDDIPRGILRWMGQGVTAFGSDRPDEAQGLLGYASVGGQKIVQPITGALSQGAGAGGSLLGGGLSSLGGGGGTTAEGS
jgi:conjugal transfer/type IV secretion protein DotA/TraY